MRLFKRSLPSQEVIKLLDRLKEQAPEYPVELMAKRKAALIKQVATANLDGNSQGGGSESGGGNGGSGGSGAPGGSSTTQGIFLQTTIGLSIIAAMLTAAYQYLDQSNDLLHGNDNGSMEQTSAQPTESPATAIETPTTEFLLAEDVPATESPGPEDFIIIGATPEALSVTDDTLVDPEDKLKSNQGLHLGQTPGPPDTPIQDNNGNSGNSNKPDKPEKSKK